MKKALKITGITLASIVGLVLIVAIIALSTVTSPKRLTKMVKKYLPEYVNFDVELERANLTLVKTFPDIGLELDEVAILSPMEGAPSDTLAKVKKLTLSANAKKFLKEKQIVVNRCILDDAMVNLFTDAEGHSNLDIFSSESEEDTASKPFDYAIDLKEVKLNNATVLYTDLTQNLNAGLKGLDLDVEGNMTDQNIQAVLSLQTQNLDLKTEGLSGQLQGLQLNFDGAIKDFNDIEGRLQLGSPEASLFAGYPVLDHDKVDIDFPVKMSIKPLQAHLDASKVGLNDYLIQLNGDAVTTSNGDMNLDVDFSTNTLDIEDVMGYLPENVAKSLAGIQFKGKIDLSEGKVNGILNDSLMPVITAKVNATDAVVNIPQMPYPFTKVDLQTAMKIDLNDSINANDIKLNAVMNRSKIKVNGKLSDLADNMDLDVNLKADMPLNDLKGFLPKNIRLDGQSKVNLTLKSKLDDFLKTVTEFKFNKRVKADATIAVNQFSFAMDTIQAAASKMDLALTLPASRKASGRTGAYLGLNSPQLDANVGQAIQAQLKDMQLTTAVDHLSGTMEDILADAHLNLGRLNFDLDTIHVDADHPKIHLETTPKNNKSLNVSIAYDGGALNANAGKAYVLNTHSLKVGASAKENKAKEDFLNRWNPTADFTLTEAELQLAGLDEKVIIPTIDFLFNANELGFKRGSVKIGKSDLTLEGNVIGINQWIDDHKNLMKGEMQLTSNYLDINEIMDLTSGMGITDEKPEEKAAVAEAEAKGDHPFLVPEGIDFTFGIKAKKALYGNFDLNDLGGTATVKDGTLLLREIGFTNEAAEMQLTAVYESPRANHLFLGMDFHLLNVQIYDLLHMIPEIDTIVPMLKTFDGAAEFHIAAQTNLKSNYEPKMSTLRASADIEGANLRVKDIVSFTKITDMLKVSTNGEYKIDSIDIQMTAFRDEVDLWPFQIAIGKYKATVDGHYNLNTVGEYHISVTDSPLPTRLGLKISGPLNNLSYSLESCKYPHLYRPERRSETEQMVMELKRMISAKLRENVL